LYSAAVRFILQQSHNFACFSEKWKTFRITWRNSVMKDFYIFSTRNPLTEIEKNVVNSPTIMNGVD